jgi:hypothetical protein
MNTKELAHKHIRAIISFCSETFSKFSFQEALVVQHVPEDGKIYYTKWETKNA